MAFDNRKISVVMPAYNEEAVVVAAISETIKVMEAIGLDHEIIVVDDGSKDDTAAAVDRAYHGIPIVKCLRSGINHGKGHALLSGYRACAGDLIVFIDADLDLHPRLISSMFEVMDREQADLVIGSKRHPDSKLDYPWHRRVMSQTYYMITRIIFNLPVKDTQTGIKIFRRRVLDEIAERILVKKYAFDLELLVNANHHHFKIVEAPIKLDFQGKFGRIKTKDIWNTLIDTLAIYYRLKILKYYSRPAEQINVDIIKDRTRLIPESVISLWVAEQKEKDLEQEKYCEV